MAKAATGDLAGRLAERISKGQLPGDAPLTAERAADIAAFLIAAAQDRAPEQPVIVIGSETGAGASGSARCLRVAVINRDMPFLVDSIAGVFAAQGLGIDLLVHPVLPVRRQAGALAQVPEGAAEGEARESWIYLETDRVDARARKALEAELATTMADVRAAVADWPQMQARMRADADLVADAEGAALLRWLGSGNMTQLGHLVRQRSGKAGTASGICRASATDLLSPAAYDKAFAWFDGADGAPGRAPLILKANRLAQVHRRVPLDLFIVPLFEDGRVAALSVHAGLWTSAALATPPDGVPVLRQHLQALKDQLGFAPGSHDHKALVHALTALPHDLVVSFAEKDLVRVATAMMALADRPRPRALLAPGPLGRHLFAFVWLPRDLVSTATRLQTQDLLERHTGGTTLDWSLMVEGGNLATLRFVLDIREGGGAVDDAALDQALQQMLRGWADAVEEALATGDDSHRAAALAARHAPAFPQAYRGDYGAGEAALDIARLIRLPVDNGITARDVRLYARAGAAAGELRLKVYQWGGALPLSDAVPALENFGFRVLSEVLTQLSGDDGGAIHDFVLGLPPALDPEALLARAAPVEAAIRAVLTGEAENDLFNRLVTAVALSAQEAEWLRAMYRYLRQASIAYTINTVVDALAAAPAVTRALVELLRCRHDPAFKGNRAAAADAAESAIRDGLAQVTAINDDRLLRLYRDTIRAILRTNAFAPAGMQALAFKFDSAAVPGLPRPVPWREIFVYSQRVEGIHLRAGPVARGGLRWSDRRDDYRTEILGLMKAQKVKNAVIVPTGAKGGFYPKRLPNPAVDRDAWFAEGKASYQLFIRTLLSITDNIVADKVVHPAGVVIHDGEDPYFVVAADKGTATFSDTANAIALEAGFWLGDAFASGGSNGYDHKAMGITARGAWLSVQRHFAEMGVDVQADPVRVAGVGDMSGDVFGNGMLLSQAIKLVAAFDHRHIFIDPDPDPAISHAERARLFALPRSSWADYDAKLISPGGGVWPRSAKVIDLPERAREVLGITDPAPDPETLLSAILAAPVDLLWFGGIGTYVKGPLESHQQVGDPANDAIRVDAGQVRAKVIGEGANLGITQAGRIAFALGGGRINTDFIDNSAGVDCSDNEVNIKIALAAAQASGKLAEKRRIALLADMTDAVAALVLEDNRLQALALSIAEAGGARAVPAHARLIEALEESGGLDRRTEGLADAEGLARRAADGAGLTRPELAVLLSSAKLALQAAIETSPLPQDEAAEALLLGDFPQAMQGKFRAQLLGHRLRPQIVGTVLANVMVNRIGMIHPFELAEEEGASLATIAAAFLVASDLFAMPALWQALETAPMPEAARLALFDHAAQALRAHVADLVRTAGGAIAPAALCAALRPPLAALAKEADALLGDAARGQADGIAAQLLALGAPADLAGEVARLYALDGSIGLALLARDTALPPVALARAFVELGEVLGIGWAQAQAATLQPADPWERLLVAGLARDFQQMRLAFLRQRLKGRRNGAALPASAISQWAGEHEAAISRLRRVIGRARQAPVASPAMLAGLAGQARQLLSA